MIDCDYCNECCDECCSPKPITNYHGAEYHPNCLRAMLVEDGPKRGEE